MWNFLQASKNKRGGVPYSSFTPILARCLTDLVAMSNKSMECFEYQTIFIVNELFVTVVTVHVVIPPRIFLGLRIKQFWQMNEDNAPFSSFGFLHLAQRTVVGFDLGTPKFLHLWQKKCFVCLPSCLSFSYCVNGLLHFIFTQKSDFDIPTFIISYTFWFWLKRLSVCNSTFWTFFYNLSFYASLFHFDNIF